MSYYQDPAGEFARACPPHNKRRVRRIKDAGTDNPRAFTFEPRLPDKALATGSLNQPRGPGLPPLYGGDLEKEL